MRAAYPLWPALVLLACEAASDELPLGILRVGSVAVQSDANGDGRLNPGESARLRVSFEGRLDDRLTCTVTSETPGVEVQSWDADLSVSYCGACTSDVAVQVGAQVAAGTVARFRCDAFTFEIAIEDADVALAVDDVRIERDDNGDGVLNPGERATLQIGVRDDGGADITRSGCVVASQTVGVEVQAYDDDLDFPYCSAGQTCGASSVAVTVAPDLAPGTLARFTCALVDEQEATREIAFQTRVERSAARPIFDGFTVRDGEALGPGYAGQLTVRLQNVGASALTSARCTVISDAAWLTVQAWSDALSYSHCAADADCGSASVAVEVAEDAPPGAQATLRCDLVDDQDQVWPLRLPIALP